DATVTGVQTCALPIYSYVADTRYSWVGIGFPLAGGARAVGLSLGTFGFSDQPVYTVDQPDGTGQTYSVAETFVQATYGQNFSDQIGRASCREEVWVQV